MSLREYQILLFSNLLQIIRYVPEMPAQEMAFDAYLAISIFQYHTVCTLSIQLCNL